MGERDGSLMPIGRFSETTRLSVKALRLYDEMRLLKPEHVDERNGYRYYGPSQVPKAEAIRILRSVDMPLDEIGQVLGSNPDNRDQLMSAHLDRLETGLTAMKQKLVAFQELVEGRKPLMPYEVTEKEVDSIKVASVIKEVDLKTIGGAIGEGFGTIMGVLAPQGHAPTGAPFVIYHDVIDEENAGKVEMCIPIAADFEPSGPVESKELRGGKVASTVHKGAYNEIAPAYHAVSSWISANGYEPAAPPAEVYLNDPTEVSVSEQLTEVMWAIKKAGA